MDIQELWERALKNTEIIRPRVQELHTFSSTQLPYVFLSESSINAGDTVVRKGEVLVEKPSLILPADSPQFEGFSFTAQSDLFGCLCPVIIAPGQCFFQKSPLKFRFGTKIVV